MIIHISSPVACKDSFGTDWELKCVHLALADHKEATIYHYQYLNSHYLIV